MLAVSPAPQLSATEARIAALVAEGLTNREIAPHVYLHETTVKWHISRLLRRLGLRRRAQLAAFYRDWEAGRL